MGVLHDLYHGENDYDFRKAWRVGLVISAVLVLISVVSLATRGLNYGIDFEGGGSWEVPDEEFSIEDARDVMRDFDEADATIQTATTENGARLVRIEAGVDAVEDPETADEISDALAEAAGIDVNEVSVNTVGPTWGDTITEKAVRALVFFLLAIALYISIRLEWRMAIGALTAVVHDIVICVGVYSVFQFEVTPATVVAFLTILGFSLYDTIVVFDKVRENQARVGLANRMTITQLMNLSLNQTLMRSINTTLVTIIPVISLLVIGSLALGARSLEEFGLALFVGLVSGAYSSIVVAAPVVAWLKEREPRNRALRERIERGDVRAGAPEPAKAAGRRAPAPTTTSPTPRPSATPSGAIPPRPRKQKKRR